MLKSKSEFARMAGVTPSAVTQACKSSLAAACSGKRIDASHPDAVKYLEERARAQTPAPASGVDPLYEEALEFCRQQEKPTARKLRAALSVGQVRADKIFATIQATGALQLPAVDDPPPMPAIKPPRMISGHTAKNRTKKSEALENLISGRTLHEVPEDIETFADMTLRELIQRFGTDVAFKDWLDATKSIEAINGARIKNAAAEGKLISRELVRKGVIDVFNSAFLRLMTDGAKTIATEVAMKIQAGAEPGELEAHVSEVLGSFIKPVKAKAARILRNA